MPSVSDLLAASREAHRRYRANSTNRMVSPHIQRAHLEDARTSRQYAHDADPDHADPAWALDLAPHAELMAFYEDYLARIGAR